MQVSGHVGVYRVHGWDCGCKRSSCTSAPQATIDRQPGRRSRASAHSAMGILLILMKGFTYGNRKFVACSESRSRIPNRLAVDTMNFIAAPPGSGPHNRQTSFQQQETCYSLCTKSLKAPMVREHIRHTIRKLSFLIALVRV